MKVEKVNPEVTYKLELSTKEYMDVKRVLYWARSDEDYPADDRELFEKLHLTMNENV